MEVLASPERRASIKSPCCSFPWTNIHRLVRRTFFLLKPILREVIGSEDLPAAGGHVEPHLMDAATGPSCRTPQRKAVQVKGLCPTVRPGSSVMLLWSQ